MSHSPMEVILPNGVTWYGESNDTVGQLCPMLFATAEARDTAWRNQKWDQWCLGDGDGCVIVTALELDWGIEHEVCTSHVCFVTLRGDDE